ncbi:hypothetical protein EDD16DRAFT_1522944 [Pisolithus croceorrhizus]|nr:hypothetical protein EDD16DRAFT_1522944 [Pisolithus croceorrhizus]KAI6127489.1 hypothetical protein EV401DRAFT_1885444 [Pisolithus croceorrhizus]KAI6149072.1 hypothetical protein EDD17DRAFT_1513944 [Pisolithus thermaeus]
MTHVWLFLGDRVEIPVHEELEWMWALFLLWNAACLGAITLSCWVPSRGIRQLCHSQLPNAPFMRIFPRTEAWRTSGLAIHPDTEGVHHFIVSITSTEIQFLTYYGYVPSMDEVYNIVWQPLMNKHWLNIWANVMLTDFRLSNEIMHLNRGIDRVLGSDALGGSFMQFLAPEDILGTYSQVVASLTEHVKAEGIDHGHLNNAFMKSTNLVMEWHLKKLAWSRPSANQTLNSLRVMTHATFFMEQDQFSYIEVDEKCQNIMQLVLAKQAAEDVKGRKYGMVLHLFLHTSIHVRK